MASETSHARSALQRRRLRFHSFDEALADARRLHQGRYETLGNWSLGRALGHLGQAMHASVEGGTFKVAWWLKIAGRLVLKPMMTRWKFPSGFKLPRRAEAILVPEPDISFEEGMARFESGIERLKTSTQRGAHPVLGPMNVDQWNGFHLRHCELHLSFFVPLEE